jgi:hypothetical protein
MLTGCQTMSVTTTATPETAPYFPVRWEYIDGSLDSLTRGILAVEDNYIRIRTIDLPGAPLDSSSISMLAIWPNGYTLDTKGPKIQILNRENQPVAVIGDYIYAGGSGGWTEAEVSKEKFNSILSQPLPENAHGPFWVVGPQDSPMELLRGLFYNRNILPDTPNTVFEGTLNIEKGSKGYLSIELDNGIKVLPLWPSGYTYQISNYTLTILDNQGKSLAAVGEKIKISGFELSPDLVPNYSWVQTPDEKYNFISIARIIGK